MTNTVMDGIKGWSVRTVKAMAFCLGAALALSAQAQVKGDATATQKANAAASSPVSVHLEQFKVLRGDKGEEKFLPAESVKPGDVIEYRATYTNVSKKPVKALVAVVPLPEGLEYIPESTKPVSPAAEAAAKDGRYAAQPLVREVKGKDGKVHTERVPYYEYRSLRWNIGDLVVGKAFEVKARARVGTSQPDAEPQAAQAPPRGSVSPTSVSVAH